MLQKRRSGFSLVELSVVIVIIGTLAAVSVPRMLDLSSNARVKIIESLSVQIKSTVALAKSKARIDGLSPAARNPGGGRQSQFVVDFGYGISEVDWRNLCPESRAELGDRMSLIDFLDIDFDTGLSSRVSNRYTFIGYDLPRRGRPTTQGCYVIYDSFGAPDCTVQTVTVDC